MRESGLTLHGYVTSCAVVSRGLKVSLTPGLTVSLGLPFRGRDRETETGEMTGPRSTPDRGLETSQPGKNTERVVTRRVTFCDRKGIGPPRVSGCPWCEPV
jgi:hypothetical protein